MSKFAARRRLYRNWTRVRFACEFLVKLRASTKVRIFKDGVKHEIYVSDAHGDVTETADGHVASLPHWIAEKAGLV